jgi:hypothetical protein
MSEVKILGPEWSYPTIINAYITEKRQKEAEGPRKWNPLRPSSAGHCTRKLAYEFMEYRGKAKYETRVIEPDIHRTFAMGHALEYNMIRDMEACDVFEVRYKQQTVEFFRVEGEIFEGSVDLCVFMKGSKGVIDWKSKKEKFVSKWESDWDEYNKLLPTLPYVKQIDEFGFYIEDLDVFIDDLKDPEGLNDPWLSDNFVQLNVYANSQFLIDRGVDHGSILQINKNKSKIREIRFKPSVKLFLETQTKFKMVIEAVDKKSDPTAAPRDYEKDSYRCRYCDFRKTCWEIKSRGKRA